MSEKSEIKEKIAIEKRMCLMGSNEPAHTSNSQTDTVIRKLGIYDPECDVLKPATGTSSQGTEEFKNYDSINEVYILSHSTDGYSSVVSWSSRMHPDTVQPFKNLYQSTAVIDQQHKWHFFNLNKSELNIDGLNINFESNPGIIDEEQDDTCIAPYSLTTSTGMSELWIGNGNTQIAYFGICIQNEREYILEPNQGIKAVHKFTDNTLNNSYHGKWTEDSPESSDFNKLEFGNFYLFEITKDIVIPGLWSRNSGYHDVWVRLENCNPESDNPVCCDGFDQVITTTGNQIDLQDITISGFENGGKLCMSNLNYDDASAITDSSTSFFHPTIALGGLITLTVQPKNSIIRYTSINGTCYQANLSGSSQTLEEVQ